ncbi:MAG TPA: hypothetical protein VK435_02440, partial [Thermodesulfovibrionales bacterium]|nr:hypothetical protein [Thermodesulfovibrionales bacterium]
MKRGMGQSSTGPFFNTMKKVLTGRSNFENNPLTAMNTWNTLLLIVGILLQCVFPASGVFCADADQPASYCDCISSDEDDGRIRYPVSVFFESVKNEIYVIDSMARIIIYTADLFPIQTLDKRNGIDAPQGLTVDTDGNLYVVQGISKDNPICRISVFNACFRWVRDINVHGFADCDKFIPYRIAVDKD